jgi:hypothetical protein
MVHNPTFVIGTGRSGLTPLMHLIAYHEAFAWPSQYNDRWPHIPRLSLLSRLVERPPLDSSLKFRRYVPTHTEAYRLWNRCYPGFANPHRDLVAGDVTPLARELFPAAVERILRYQSKDRFIAEYSGWSRIEFLKAIFPGARFIHIVRDGRAVANSYLSVDWWDGWRGVYGWRLGVPAPDVLDKLARYDQSFLALAALYWHILVTNISDKSAPLTSDEYLLVRYEDVVDDPEREARRCIDFCGLDADGARFARHLASVRIVDANNETFRIPSWKRTLTTAQIDMLNELLKEDLERFGYVG